MSAAVESLIVHSSTAPKRTVVSTWWCENCLPSMKNWLVLSFSENVSVAREPGPRVTFGRCRTAAKVDSIGFVVRRWIQCSAGYSWNLSSSSVGDLCDGLGELRAVAGLKAVQCVDLSMSAGGHHAHHHDQPARRRPVRRPRRACLPGLWEAGPAGAAVAIVGGSTRPIRQRTQRMAVVSRGGGWCAAVAAAVWH
jgi:hypothetical protein